MIINASNDPADRLSPVFLVARGALQQGAYWDVVDRLYSVGLGAPEALADVIRQHLGLGHASLADSLSDATVRAAVAADFSDYVALGLRGTPTFLLRKLGRDHRWRRAMIEDLQPRDYFEETLDRLLNEP